MKARIQFHSLACAGLFFACSGALALPMTISPAIVNPANGSTYYLLSSSGWTDAEAAAQGLGGHLATVRNQAEQDWLSSIFSSYGGQDRFLWIGLNDAEEEGTWVWASGEPVTYTHWQTWEPNSLHPNEDYVQMFGVNNNQGFPAGLWNDIYDSAWPYQGAPSGHNFGPVYGIAEITRIPDAGGTALLTVVSCAVMAGLRFLVRRSGVRSLGRVSARTDPAEASQERTAWTAISGQALLDFESKGAGSRVCEFGAVVAARGCGVAAARSNPMGTTSLTASACRNGLTPVGVRVGCIPAVARRSD